MLRYQHFYLYLKLSIGPLKYLRITRNSGEKQRPLSLCGCVLEGCVNGNISNGQQSHKNIDLYNNQSKEGLKWTCWADKRKTQEKSVLFSFFIQQSKLSLQISTSYVVRHLRVLFILSTTFRHGFTEQKKKALPTT